MCFSIWWLIIISTIIVLRLEVTVLSSAPRKKRTFPIKSTLIQNQRAMIAAEADFTFFYLLEMRAHVQPSRSQL